MGSQQTIDSLYEALAGDDVEAILAHFAENIVYRVYAATASSATFTGDVAGIDALRERFGTMYSTWRVDTLSKSDVAVDGSRAALSVDFDATAYDGGRTLSTKSSHFLTLRDGRVEEFEIFLNEVRTARLPALDTEYGHVR